MKDILICIFQRGAADGLNSVIPHADPEYYALRPRVAVPPPGATGGALDLDGFFGVYAEGAGLKTLFDAGRLAAVHATGFPHGTRSHFNAQAFVEAGLTDGLAGKSGWVGRHLAATTSANDRPFRAVAISGAVPLILNGADDPLAVDSLEAFGLGNTGGTSYEAILGALYGPESPYSDVASAALAAINELAIAMPTQFLPEHGAVYPQSQLGGGLLQAAQLIKADLGVEVVCVDVGNWDHHENLPSVMPGSIGDLAASLLAFDTDMGDRMNGITVLVQTEFGRRAADNISSGTDHGTGGVAWLMGGGVIGGQVATDWPGLKAGDLYQGEDVAITADLRAVLVQMLERRLANPNAGEIFPGYVPTVTPELFLTQP